MNTSPNRRRFLAGVSGAAAGIAVARVIAQTVRADTSKPAPGQGRSFRGLEPGEERDGRRTSLLVSARTLHDGEPAGERGRRPDEAQVGVRLSRGFWTANQKSPRANGSGVGKFPDRPPSRRVRRGRRRPGLLGQLPRGRGFCAELSRRGHRSGALPAELGIRAADRGAVGVRLPRRHHTARRPSATRSARHQANFASDSPDRSVRAARRAPATSAAIRPTPGASTTCTATSGNGAGTTTTRSCRAARSRPVEPAGIPNRDGTYSRVRRGGAWIEAESSCRSACRLRYEPHRRSDHIGFRVFVVERASS